MLNVLPLLRPALDPDFLPAALWNQAFRAVVAADLGSRPFVLVLERADGGTSVHESRVLAVDHPAAALNLRHAERLLKFLLWQKGSAQIRVIGAPELPAQLPALYRPGV